MDSGRLDDSLTNIQWLGRMSTCALQSDPAKQKTNKENQSPNSQAFQVSCSFLSPFFSLKVNVKYLQLIAGFRPVTR